LAVGPLLDPNPTFMVVRDDAPVLYVADNQVPLIHVIDVSNPAAPVEVSSYVATSQVQPTRLVQVGALALSPPTHMFDPVTGRAIRYLYAIDTNDGTLMVFDATNPIPPPFTPPLERPHSELNPFSAVDRLSFSAPVAAVAFVQHDWPLFPPNIPNTIAGYTGLICNPNPNTRTDTTGTISSNDPSRFGAYYATDQAGVIEPQGTGTESFPGRLRGTFGFVTLSNGNLVAIDVDDWDAPCRRPDPMDPFHQVGLLALPQQDATGDPSDIDPYHAPSAHGSSVAYTTQETFFPVSAPNRMRSNYLLRNDPTSGDHEPYMPGPPQLLSSAGAPVAGIGQSQSILLPTALPAGWVDPAYYATPTDPNDSYGSLSTPLGSADAEALSLEAGSPLFPAATTSAAVRMSLDDPTAHEDQDWTVTYEGALPQVSPLVVNMGTTDGYQSMVLTVGGPAPDGGPSNAQFCAMGIEDWSQGQIRANAALAEMTRLGLPIPVAVPPAPLPQWTADYVEIVDDLKTQDDPYWAVGGTPPDGGPGGYACWDGTGLEAPEQAADRYNLCQQTYGPLGENADSYLSRDFPIAEASDGSLVIGRFGYPGNSQGEQTNNRTVVGPDPSNVLFLKEAACCFHGQAGVKIRTGGEWVTLGQNGLGLLHHVVPDPSTGRCVQSTAPHDQLLNARAFEVPFFDETNGCAPPATTPPSIERTDILAMRNPMFSYVMWSGCTPFEMFQHTSTARDLNWHFSLRGGFQPLTIQLGGGTLLPIVPQAMAFAPAFEQLAIVDGSYQGLILIDLSSLTFAHTPYF
ncbi:MAG TPA: hypothetical protein VK841_16480, partial [Polyangiaceae bacterium]|nr:hypothetical protein [Polyangiaceae bacterium]